MENQASMKWFFYGFLGAALALVGTGCNWDDSIPTMSEQARRGAHGPAPVVGGGEAPSSSESPLPNPPEQTDDNPILVWQNTKKKVYRNDSWRKRKNRRVYIKRALIAGDIVAVRFKKDRRNRPVKLRNVKVLFAGKKRRYPTGVTAKLKIWKETGRLQPGELLFEKTVRLRSMKRRLNVIRLKEHGIVVENGRFRVGLEFQHDGLPTVGMDKDRKPKRRYFKKKRKYKKALRHYYKRKLHRNRNLVYLHGMGWVRSKSIGARGDWIIRAVVDQAQIQRNN